jgi:hypothetical protein
MILGIKLGIARHAPGPHGALIVLNREHQLLSMSFGSILESPLIGCHKARQTAIPPVRWSHGDPVAPAIGVAAGHQKQELRHGHHGGFLGGCTKDRLHVGACQPHACHGNHGQSGNPATRLNHDKLTPVQNHLWFLPLSKEPLANRTNTPRPASCHLPFNPLGRRKFTTRA